MPAVLFTDGVMTIRRVHDASESRSFSDDHFEVADQLTTISTPASTGTTTSSDSVESKSTHNSTWWLSYSMIASPVPQSVALHCRHTACIRPRPRSYPAVAGHPWLEHRHLAGCHHDHAPCLNSLQGRGQSAQGERLSNLQPQCYSTISTARSTGITPK